MEYRHTNLGAPTHHESALRDTAIATAQQLCPIPTIEMNCVCIVDRENVAIAAVISSYFGDRATYPAIFDFPRLRHANGPDTAFEDDAFIARMVGNEHAVVIKNALAKLRPCRRVILAGLDDVQESYLTFLGKFEVIRIADVGAVDTALAPIGLVKTSELRCRPEQVLIGLYAARSAGACLMIDSGADDVTPPPLRGGGLFVVERIDNVSAVAAVNLAHSIHANVTVVEPLDEEEPRQILALIHNWKENSSATARAAVEEKIGQRVRHLAFDQFRFVTYFTAGLPYALASAAAIPTSYVHLMQHATLFIFNAISAESTSATGVAFIFALDELEMAGEAAWLDQFLTERNYHVRSLVGSEATHDAFDYNAQHFPYNILHVASHGGQVSGYDVLQRFIDRQGEEHVVRFDQVVAFGSRRDDDGRIQVISKAIFRSLDGYAWKSQELRDRNYPSYVFEDMRIAMLDPEARKAHVTRTPKALVTSSCHIQCADGLHQGMFRQIAGYRGAPIVFNNACWSWSDISSFFITGGARAYVGTLWAIETDTAVVASHVFYEAILAGVPIVEALSQVNAAIRDTPDAEIYMVWALPFSTMPISTNIDTSRSRAVNDLMQLLDMYIRQVQEAQGTHAADVRRNALDTARQIYVDIVTGFDFVGADTFGQNYGEQLGQLATLTRSGSAISVPELADTDDSLDLPAPFDP